MCYRGVLTICSSFMLLVCFLLPTVCTEKKMCPCIKMKDLRDLTPMYPVLRSKFAKFMTNWRKIEISLSESKEKKLSQLNVNLLGNL